MTGSTAKSPIATAKDSHQWRRVFLYTSAILIVLFITLQSFNWLTSAALHTIIETSTTQLAFIAGALAMLRFYSKRNIVYLFVGVGLLGAGALDGYHAIVTSAYFKPFMPSDIINLIPWSWVASRQYLAIVLFVMAILVDPRNKAFTNSTIRDSHVFIVSAIFMLVSFIFFATMPLPQAYYPELFFHRPEEFIPAIFFALAFNSIIRNNDLMADPFSNWLLLSILVGFICQALYMSSSHGLFDMAFDMAHLLKMASYLIIIIGLMASVYRTFQTEEEARIQASAANEAKSDFLAMMSHEIRTPMNGVLGAAQLLQKTSLTVDQRNKLDILISSGNTMITLLNDILDFSKIEKGKISFEEIDFNLENSLEGLISIFHESALEKKITLETAFNLEKDRIFRGDVTRIRQIIWNLLSNAIKFTQEGTVTISIDEVEDASFDSIEGEDIIIRICVRDTGIGIPKDKQDAIFQAFHQADISTTRQFGGSGLGLSIVTKLTRLMNGKIHVSSTENTGSEFIVTLKLKIGSPDKLIITPDASEDLEQNTVGTLNVLVAEDQPLNARIASEFLKQLGHNVTIAENGLQAVDAVMAGQYDMVLMDNHMPIMNGREATEKIRAMDDKQKASIPVIGLTADAYHSAHKALMGSGMDFVLTKPVMDYDLIKAINMCFKGDETSSPAMRESIENPEESSTDKAMEEFDAHCINLIKSTLGAAGFDDFIKEVINCFDEFSRDFPIEIAAVDDPEKVKRMLHNIKGVSSQVGAVRLSKHIAGIEQDTKEGLFNKDRADQLTNHIKQVCDSIRANY